MKLFKLHTERYRSLLDVTVELGALTFFIGANASGKRTILDALCFLGEAMRKHDGFLRSQSLLATGD